VRMTKKPPNLEPGPELDALMAEIMGWTQSTTPCCYLVPIPGGSGRQAFRCVNPNNHMGDPNPPTPWHPGTDMNHAMEVAAKVFGGKWLLAVEPSYSLVRVFKKRLCDDVFGRAETSAHAICLAAREAQK